MSNVTSSAILIVVTTIISAILMSAFIFMYNSYTDVQTGAEDKQAEMNVSNKTNDYDQYIGSTIRGDKLLGVLRNAEGSDITIYVQNGHAMSTYDFQKELFYNTDATFWNNVSESASNTAAGSGNLVVHKENHGQGVKDYYIQNFFGVFSLNVNGTAKDTSVYDLPGNTIYGNTKNGSGQMSSDPYSAWYIDPFDNFTCTGDSEHGTTHWLLFSRQ